MTKGVLLCVDDNADFCRILIDFFTRRGYDAISALSAEEGYKIIKDKARKVGMLLLDLRMEGMGGLGLLRKLKEEKIDIPTLVLTAFSQDIPALEQEHFKLCGYFEKPVDLMAVYEAVRKFIKK